MIKAVTYTRVSTNRQAVEGESLTVQNERLHAYAKSQGMQIIQQYEERGISGSIPLDQRPEGKAMLDNLDPGTAVLVTKFDRIFRSAHDTLNNIVLFEERQITLHALDFGGNAFASNSSMGRAMVQIRAIFAELERNLARERTCETIASKKARGERVGQIPFGYTEHDGQIREHGDRPLAIETMKQLRTEGNSYRTIADIICHDFAAQGFSISANTVKKLTEDAM